MPDRLARSQSGLRVAVPSQLYAIYFNYEYKSSIGKQTQTYATVWSLDIWCFLTVYQPFWLHLETPQLSSFFFRNRHRTSSLIIYVLLSSGLAATTSTLSLTTAAVLSRQDIVSSHVHVITLATRASLLHPVHRCGTIYRRTYDRTSATDSWHDASWNTLRNTLTYLLFVTYLRRAAFSQINNYKPCVTWTCTFSQPAENRTGMGEITESIFRTWPRTKPLT